MFRVRIGDFTEELAASTLDEVLYALGVHFVVRGNQLILMGDGYVALSLEECAYE